MGRSPIWLQGPTRSSRFPIGPSPRCGLVLRAASTSSISSAVAPRVRCTAAMRCRCSRCARSRSNAFFGSVVAVSITSRCRATPRVTDSRFSSSAFNRRANRSAADLRWGCPGGYIERLCRTIENSIRKSASSRDRDVTCLGLASGSGDEEAASSSGGCSDSLFGLDSAPISMPRERAGMEYGSRGKWQIPSRLRRRAKPLRRRGISHLWKVQYQGFPCYLAENCWFCRASLARAPDLSSPAGLDPPFFLGTRWLTRR